MNEHIIDMPPSPPPLPVEPPAGQNAKRARTKNYLTAEESVQDDIIMFVCL